MLTSPRAKWPEDFRALVGEAIADLGGRRAIERAMEMVRAGRLADAR